MGQEEERGGSRLPRSGGVWRDEFVVRVERCTSGLRLMGVAASVKQDQQQLEGDAHGPTGAKQVKQQGSSAASDSAARQQQELQKGEAELMAQEEKEKQERALQKKISRENSVLVIAPREHTFQENLVKQDVDVDIRQV